jgi:gluconokinase
MASGTGLLNLRSCEWEVDLLNKLDIDSEKLPQICRPGQTLNQFTDHYAARWPQLSEAQCFPAIGDGAANNVGAGCTSKDHATLMVGTSGAMRVVYEDDPPRVVPPGLWCYRLDRNRVVTGGALSDGGNLYGWLRDSLLVDIDTQSIEDEIALMAPDAHGLTVLPFWFGERSTGWSERMRGTIHGLSSATQPIEILRAAMEAVAYRFAMIADALNPLAPDTSLIASGHALWSSPAWVQILADVLGSPIQLSKTDEASTRGAALLALEAAGKIQTINRHSATVTTIPKVFEPDMTRHQRYREALERQQRLYEKMLAQN